LRPLKTIEIWDKEDDKSLSLDQSYAPAQRSELEVVLWMDPTLMIIVSEDSGKFTAFE
jgi:hypothetical protein